MTWVLLIGAGWLLVALVVSVLIGRGIRIADRKEEESAAAEAPTPNFVVDAGAPAEPSTEEAPPSPDDATAAERASERERHRIPAARLHSAPKPIRAERRSSPRRPGLF